jgi:hypothetical protein
MDFPSYGSVFIYRLNSLLIKDLYSNRPAALKEGRSGSAEAENKLDGIEKRRRDQDDLYEEVNENP